METVPLHVLDSIQEINNNRTEEPYNEELNLPPSYSDSIDFNAPRNNIGLEDVNPIIVRIPHRNSLNSSNNDSRESTTVRNDEFSNIDLNQQNNQSSFTSNTSRSHTEHLDNIENSSSEMRTVLMDSESDPFLAEVRYIIQPKPPEEPAFSMATAICLLGCCFPPFWFLGSLLIFQTKPQSLARGWAVISISLSLGFSFFFVIGVLSYAANPEKWDSLVRACFPWI